jgi:hypothetical protein
MFFRICSVFVLLVSNVVFAVEEKNTLGSGVQASPEVCKIEGSEIASLSFDEFFKMPVGPYGLEISEKLMSLDGKKVRIRGYMVKEDRCRAGHAHNPADAHKEVVYGRFMLSPAPVMISYACFGTSDDLFPQTVFVRVGELPNNPIPYTSTPLELVGTLSVGPSEEPDDRISQVRLALDPLPADVVAKMSEAYQTAHSHSHHSGCKHGPEQN